MSTKTQEPTAWERPTWSVWAWRAAHVASFVVAFVIGRFVL